ncbi:UNVERIFIED_CONTAM: Retrovirus-related Pol polyprotein from transposon TNT 1-94 [Sesamum radiatum]|uniref:Retrovirus-related Pol polyprotein from transposon TNT 1-94 n=1 Tax=Sesamum radiatum TaxID=300843 RepID=A0AAW2QHW1_SESRA
MGKSKSTPLIHNEKHSKSEKGDETNASLYRSHIGSLLYLSATRPDLMYAANVFSRFMQSLGQVHMGAAKRVLRYVQEKVLADLHLSQASATIIVDNQSAISMAKTHVPHGRTKHINVKFHSIREAKQNEEVELVHCNSDVQVVDILTKSLSKGIFEVLKAQLGVLRKNLKEE